MIQPECFLNMFQGFQVAEDSEKLLATWREQTVDSSFCSGI